MDRRELVEPKGPVLTQQPERAHRSQAISTTDGTPIHAGTAPWSPIAWAHHSKPKPMTGACARNATATTSAVGSAATTTRTSAIVTNRVASRGGRRRCADVAISGDAERHQQRKRQRTEHQRLPLWALALSSIA